MYGDDPESIVCIQAAPLEFRVPATPESNLPIFSAFIEFGHVPSLGVEVRSLDLLGCCQAKNGGMGVHGEGSHTGSPRQGAISGGVKETVK